MRKLFGDERGAVYVEFLAAFLPLFIFFESLVQFAGLVTAKLVVQHAAVSAARAAIVVLPDDPDEYDNEPVGSISGKRLDAIENAAAITLRTLHSFVDFKVTFPTSSDGKQTRTKVGRDDLVRVKVEATYHCSVPLANRLVCNPTTSLRTLTATAALPNQGADYEY